MPQYWGNYSQYTFTGTEKLQTYPIATRWWAMDNFSLSEIRAEVGNNSTEVNIKAAVYDHDVTNNVPENKVAETSTVSVPAGAISEVSLPLIAPYTMVRNTLYWVAIECDTSDEIDIRNNTLSGPGIARWTGGGPYPDFDSVWNDTTRVTGILALYGYGSNFITGTQSYGWIEDSTFNSEWGFGAGWIRWVRSSSIPALTSHTVDRIRIYHSITADVSVRFGIYDHNSGSDIPVNLLAQTPITALSYSDFNQGRHWHVYDLTTPLQITAGNYYWIAFISSLGSTFYMPMLLNNSKAVYRQNTSNNWPTLLDPASGYGSSGDQWPLAQLWGYSPRGPFPLFRPG